MAENDSSEHKQKDTGKAGLSNTKKRRPAEELFVSQIDAERSRVAIVGRMKSKTDTVAVFSDGTGSINLLFQKEEMLDELESGKIYRIVGVVLPHERGVELKVELVQDFSGFDVKAYHNYLKRKNYK